MAAGAGRAPRWPPALAALLDGRQRWPWAPRRRPQCCEPQPSRAMAAPPTTAVAAGSP